MACAPFSGQKLTVRVLAKDEDGDDIYYTFVATTAGEGTLTRNGMAEAPVTISECVCASATGHCDYLFWGCGTESNPFIIANYDDLKNLSSVVHNATDDDSYNDNDCYYLQIADIAVTDNNWGTSSRLAVGSPTNAFKANYDGGHHTVDFGVTTGANDYPTGVFGVVSGGAKIRNIVSTGSISIGDAKAATGGIVGKVSGNATIYNCKNEASITSTQTGYFTAGALGGVCGIVDASGCTITIEKCTNTGAIKCSSYTNKNGGGLPAGGICGIGSQASSLSITNCINVGSVQKFYYTGSAYYYGQYAGGILGYIPSSSCTTAVSNCINRCSVVSGNIGVGGVVGYATNGTNTLRVTHCKNSARVYSGAGSGNNAHSGGIVGYCNYHNIDKCYNCGALNANTGYTIGGIIGYAANSGANSGYVTNCMVDVTGASFSGSRYMGGIIANQRGTVANTERIFNCCFFGTMTSSSEYYITGIVSIGASTPAVGTIVANNCLVNGTIPSSNSGDIYRIYSGSNAQNTNFCYANNGNGANLTKSKLKFYADGTWTDYADGTAGTNYYSKDDYPTVGAALRHWVSVNGSSYVEWTDDNVPTLNLSYNDITGYQAGL